MRRPDLKILGVLLCVAGAAFMGRSIAQSQQPTDQVIAPSPYYESKEKGWFWYEEPPAEEPRKRKWRNLRKSWRLSRSNARRSLFR